MASRLVHHTSVVRLSLFPFLTVADATRLLASCRDLYNDTENVELLLTLSPVTRVVFHSNAISHLGCLPSTPTRSLHEISCTNALSVAGLWEQELLRNCYRWHTGRRISLRLEPFLVPLEARVETVADVHDALESVLTGLGEAYVRGVDTPSRAVSFLGDDTQKTTAKEPDTEEEDGGIDAFRLSLLSDSDASDWDHSDSDSDSDCDSEFSDDDHLDEDWLQTVKSSSREPRLNFKVYRPLLRHFRTHNFTLTRWTTVPSEANDAAWKAHLLVGVSPSRHVLGGILGSFVQTRSTRGLLQRTVGSAHALRGVEAVSQHQDANAVRQRGDDTTMRGLISLKVGTSPPLAITSEAGPAFTRHVTHRHRPISKLHPSRAIQGRNWPLLEALQAWLWVPKAVFATMAIHVRHLSPTHRTVLEKRRFVGAMRSMFVALELEASHGRRISQCDWPTPLRFVQSDGRLNLTPSEMAVEGSRGCRRRDASHASAVAPTRE